MVFFMGRINKTGLPHLFGKAGSKQISILTFTHQANFFELVKTSMPDILKLQAIQKVREKAQLKDLVNLIGYSVVSPDEYIITV